MTRPTRTEALLLQTAAPWAQRAMGIVLVLIGLLFILGFIVSASVLINGVAALTAGKLAVSIITLIFSLFFSVAGVRLALRTPNRHGSLFAPWVWFTISALLLTRAGVVVAVGPKQSAMQWGQAVVSALLLALLSFGAGAHFRRRAHARRGAD